MQAINGQTTPTDTSANTIASERSSLVSRNITVNGHRTSVRLEPDMWNGLQDICRREYASLHDICTAVAARKGANTSLTAAIRVFVMAYFRAACTEDGHNKAGQGPGGSFMTSWTQEQLAARSNRMPNLVQLRNRFGTGR